jgi:hypothetical protein
LIFRLIRYGPGIILIETVFLPDQYHTRTNHIDGAMESVLASSVVGRGFEPRWGQIKDYEIDISWLFARHATGWIGIRSLAGY